MRQRIPPGAICSTSGCGRPVLARELCKRCYNRESRAGRLLPVRTVPLEVRFWQEVDKSNDCWLWIGSIDAYGYGIFLGRTKAHRRSWTLTYGPIPDGMHVLHRCDVRNCVRPDHLFLGDQEANNRDMVAKGRHANQGTHCKRGHEFTPENTQMFKNGDHYQRRCKACAKMRRTRPTP